MVIIFWLVLVLVGASLFIGSAVIWYYMSVLEFKEPVTIICPETLQSAEVKIDGKHAAKTRFAGHEELVIADCSRWPERRGCDQACATQTPIVGDDRRRTKYAAGGVRVQDLRINNPVQMTEEMYRKIAAKPGR